MNKNLILEVRGRSTKLKKHTADKKALKKLNRKLLALVMKMRREGVTPKQQELRCNDLIDEMNIDHTDLIIKDCINQIRLTDKHIGE